MKIEEQVLSIEQMKHLQELGVDTSDASMCWLRYDVGGVVKQFVEINDIKDYEWSYATQYPTYTIGDLIEKLPKSIDLGFGEYDLKMLIEGEYVQAQYTNDYDYTPFSCSQLSLIESLYSILCWLAEYHKELLKMKK